MMRKIGLLMLTGMFFLFGMSYAAEVTIPSGGDIQAAIDAAAEGDVLILENGGQYATNQLVINKSITLKAEDGYTVRPIVYCDGTSGVLFGDAGASVTELGIEFISRGARYLNRVEKNDSVHFLGMYDCVVRGFDRNFLQAKDAPSYLDSCVVEDCYVYAGGGGGYQLIYFDDVTLEYLRLSNSSFVTFDECFLKLNKGTDQVKTVIIENCNIHGRTANGDEPLFHVGGAAGSEFTIKNSIISNILQPQIWDIGDDITDTIMNVFYHNIEHDTSMTQNEWSYEEAFTATDPLFSNGDAGALYLTDGTPALTASTTGSFISASRWTELPPRTTLLDLTVNGNASLLSPAFHNDSLTYSGEIPFAFGDTIMVEALAAFADVPITGTGKHAWEGGLELSIDVVVDGTKTFQLLLTRIPPNEDPTLKRIVIRDTADTDYIFFPPDQPDWDEFDLRYPAGNPTMYVIKADLNFSGTDVSYPDSLDVSSGGGDIVFYCTAENGDTKTYTVHCMPEGTGTVTSLRKLMLSTPVDTLETTPPFNAEISNYTLEVPAGTDSLFVLAASTDSWATMVYEDTIVISGGSATVTVEVTSEDGANSQTYTVEVTVLNVGLEDDLTNNIFLYHHAAIEQLVIVNADQVEWVEIYSIAGKLMVSKNADYQNRLEISTSALPNGVYIVRLNSANEVIHATKFIK